MQVLLKAREVSHCVKLLFGSQLGVLASQAPEELTRLLQKTSLLQMMQVREGGGAGCSYSMLLVVLVQS